MIRPREYQSEAVKNVLTKWQAGVTRQLISLPTGCGKTIIFALVAEAIRARTLILAHREELLYQAEQKIKWIYPDADIGILKAEERGGLDSEICIASIQTATRHTERLAERGYKLLICDEAHHAVSNSYVKIFNALGFMSGEPDKLLLGVTATAYRGDKTGLNNVFEKIVFERSILAMMKAGYLCDIRGLEVNTGEDISCVHMQTGDFAVNELSALIDIPERNALVADTYLKYGEGRRGVIFGVKVEHAKNLAAAFRERGISCEAVYGDMPTEDRQEILTRYANHDLQMLSNVGVLTEGWDVPDTDIIMMARPTKSKGLYIQCVGRGLRLAPGKKDCLLVDFVDIAKRHELCGFGTLAGKPIKRADENQTLLEAVEAEERLEIEPRINGISAPKIETFELFERSRYVWQKRNNNYIVGLLNNQYLCCRSSNGGYSPVFISTSGESISLSDSILPLDYAMGVCEDYARQIETAKYAMKNAAWRGYIATEKQINTLLQMGVNITDGLKRGEAADLLSDKLGEGATDKQIWYIQKYRLHKNAEILTKQEAQKIISKHKTRQELINL